ncbi:torsin-1A-like [Chanos chanos]|uniref:Torsin n=1 Tax=Chanos chanos TaxID=29144 RepID=A0A6J2WDP1_CHACN|nr:torsin-1A-like [Chanos chanos]
MKAGIYFVCLCVLSNIIVVSAILDVIVGAVAYITDRLFQKDDLLEPFDYERLKTDLKDSLYGQHIASEVVLKAVSGFMTDKHPSKPLVLSFHGSTGVGKNHVSNIIARNIFTKGENSEHVHVFISEHHFPLKEQVETYKFQLKQWIRGNVSSFPRSMFIFDVMDKMNPGLIDAIKPFLDHYSHVDGVSYREAIFIFLSNAGESVIEKVVLDSWRDGEKREQLQMNSRDMETKIFKDVFNANSSGFWHSTLIDAHLIDHFIPFLPLEYRHVRQCVLAEMAALNITANDGFVDRVAQNLPYFPPEEKILSVKGCKTVKQKLLVHI